MAAEKKSTIQRVFTIVLSLSALLAVTLLFSGCANYAGDSVGTSCRDHADCPGDARCLRGSRFPGGTCTIPCDEHRDCPPFAACIDREGGVCLPLCERNRDCRSNYECEDERNFGSSGRSDVCIGD